MASGMWACSWEFISGFAEIRETMKLESRFEAGSGGRQSASAPKCVYRDPKRNDEQPECGEFALLRVCQENHQQKSDRHDVQCWQHGVPEGTNRSGQVGPKPAQTEQRNRREQVE